MDRRIAKLLASIRKTLDQERSALIAADLDLLPGLLKTKEAQLRALSGCKTQFPDADTIMRLQALALENQKLLEGVQAGLKSALFRLRSLKEAEGKIGTYDETGQKRTVRAVSVTRLEQKA